MFLEARKAVLLMVEHGMVLKRADREEGLELIWWNDRCSCFHYSKDGKYGGIYTDGIFHNLMPFFKYRSERKDNELLYWGALRHQAKDGDVETCELISELERRGSMEVLYANQAFSVEGGVQCC